MHVPITIYAAFAKYVPSSLTNSVLYKDHTIYSIEYVIFWREKRLFAHPLHLEFAAFGIE